ncbi:hypothetical protein FTX61_05365 [Nitriliruptoraceae bacterium ZYF776]|nr:hypothetical protein [Profundirhabdus halotolerans]
MPTSTPAPRRLRHRRAPSHLGAAAALLVAVVATGCGGEAEVAPDPEPPVVTAPPPEPEPEPEPVAPAPVRGEVVQETLEDTSIAGSGLYPDGSGPDAAPSVDQDAVDAAVEAATAWLDAHLTELHDGGPGRIREAGFTGDLARVTTGLASPERPVLAATYSVVVGTREAPEYVRVGVTVTREDGTNAGATFVFLPEGDDVVLLAAEPGNNTDLDDDLDDDVEDARIDAEEAS